MTNQNTPPKNICIRPTLIIGLGGTGHRIVLWLKSLFWQLWEPEQTAQWVRFLVFDTAQEDLSATHNGRTLRLEPGSELYDIGQTPVAKIKQNLARQAAIEARLGSVMANLPPTVLRSGAKQLRPLGLLAFLWRYAEIEKALHEAIWALAGRHQREGGEGLNVIIANSLVGGTGSATFLDTAYVVRDLVDQLGLLADFCTITGVGVLPRAFHGINGPNLIPNAVASLTELNHCMLHGDFRVRYPNGRVITTQQPPFNIYYLLDGVDERGHTWSSLSDVCRLAAEAIFLQIGSQVGQKQENDFDNLDEVLVQQTEEGHGTFYGSVGLASLLFPGPAVAQACAARQAQRVIAQGLLAPGPAEEELDQQVTDLIEAAGLRPARLAEQLVIDDQGVPLTIELNVPGWVNRLAPPAIPGELVRYVRDYEQARLGSDFKRWLTHNEKRLAQQGATMLRDHLARLARQAGLLTAQAWLNRLRHHLESNITQAQTRQVERESQQLALAQELGHAETAFLQAGESTFLGRGRRVGNAQHAYFTTAQHLFMVRWEAQVAASTLAILSQVSHVTQDGLAACQAVTTRLEAAQRSLAEMIELDPAGITLAGVTTRSLATAEVVAKLFEQYAPPPADTLVALFSAGASPLDWREAAPAGVKAALLTASEPPFAALTKMNVEQVIAFQAGDGSPESDYTWLTQQATPSWSLDRTRLPEGGAALQRLEVLGVPDEIASPYRQRAANLVSTGDPTRITAFVAHVGAPHSAIQQWDSYQAIYQQMRGRLPLHILPQLQVDSQWARQTFALSSLFGFIKAQGAHFYYIPADSLDRPVKLAQGLANCLAAFTGDDTLVQEARERIDQVVAQQGIEATLRRLRQYYERADDRYPADDLVLELKRLVRAYAEELRQIYQFAGPQAMPARPLDGDSGSSRDGTR